MFTDLKDERLYESINAIDGIKLRVAIFDSNVLMRQMLANLLRNIDGVSIHTSSGRIDEDSVYDWAENRPPDLIFLELEPKDESSFHKFRKIREVYPDLPIVLMTPLSDEGARVALEGLKKGAVDYVTKPDRSMGLVLASKHFYKRVLPIIRSSTRINRNLLMDLPNPESADSADADSEERLAAKSASRISSSPQNMDISTEHLSELNDQPSESVNTPIGHPDIELILASGCMGGVHSLYRWVASLPEKLPVPVVAVQHMPKIYTRYLAQELNRITALNVSEAVHNQFLEPGNIYLAPGGYHTEIRNEGNRKTLVLHRGPREHRNRPSVDVLFRSAAQNYQEKVLGICLSGGGQDGFRGVKEIRKSGGMILVESRKSSILWELPNRIVHKGLAAGEAEAEKLGSEIIKYIYRNPAGIRADTDS